MSDSYRKRRRCIVCNVNIEHTENPWSMISTTGDTVYWHTTCKKDDDNE